MIFVREADENDIEKISRLEKACFSVPWSEASIRHDILENGIARVFAAENDGEIAGYADVWIVADEGQINNIAVDPFYRRLGVGTALIETMLRVLNECGCSEASLEVRPSNTAAVGLYKKMGFREAGTREGYYLDNGESAIIMKYFF